MDHSFHFMEKILGIFDGAGVHKPEDLETLVPSWSPIKNFSLKLITDTCC